MSLSKKNSEIEIENEPLIEPNENSTWYWWKSLRTLCEESVRLAVILEITPDLPSDEEIERWLSEPVKALVIPTTLFLTNKTGFPVLSKPHQMFINKFLKVIFFVYHRLDLLSLR